jgi:hypothetical protein
MQAVVLAPEEILERLTVAAASGADEPLVVSVVGDGTSVPTPIRW